MIAGNLHKWMAMFAIDLTAVPSNDVGGRESVVNLYKEEAICTLVKPVLPPVKIDLGAEIEYGEWREPVELCINCSDEEIGGVWSDPVSLRVIEYETCKTSEEWREPSEAINIQNDVIPDVTWVEPTDPVIIDVTGKEPYGMWCDPAMWGELI